MICSSCIHSVIQKYNYGDLNAKSEAILRDVIYCEILHREVVKLVECSRLDDKIMIAGSQTGKMDIPGAEIVNLGYGAVPEKKHKGWPKGKKR